MDFTPEFRREYIIAVQGKEYITYRGLMHLKQELGTVQGIETKLLQAPSKDNGDMAIVWARVTMKDGTFFEDHGDCDNHNCNSKITPHKIRMATTRAKGRALREALGITMLMSEEMTSLKDEGEEDITPDQVNAISAMMKSKGIGRDTGKALFKQLVGKESLSGATRKEADKMINFLSTYELVPAQAPQAPKVNLADSTGEDDLDS